ncbi:CMP-sialic acid transporter 4 [Hibiscus syriacus]|uniref:Choline transporter-like protein n=1 Tax=Hibiscus syriacus TaxID=106335 RepID=A0A6A2YZV2_HIBSY|nr:CMP-sialic acid transporter 4 [Hibiscus syriacus]
MGSTEEETTSTTKPIPLYDATLPTEPLLFKPTTSSTYPSPPIEEPPQPDPSESDPTQFIQISFNYGPRPFKDLPFSSSSFSRYSALMLSVFSQSSIETTTTPTFRPSPTIPIPLLSFRIVYVLLPFFVIVPTFFDVYWFVACTLSSSCSDTFPLVYRILVLVFVLLGVGVIIWIVVANWHRIELTVRIIGVASDSLSRNLGLFLAILLLTAGLLVYYAPIVVFLVFSTFNGKIVAKESNGEYTCVWKQDSWVPTYFTLAILTMLWSLTIMVEAQVYVISGTIAQWYFSKNEEKPHRSIRRSLRNAFGPSSGTVCLSGILICVVRVVRAAVDNAREEDVPRIVNLVLWCCVNALMSAIEFLNKFTINFASITTISTRLLAGLIFVFSAVYAIVDDDGGTVSDNIENPRGTEFPGFRKNVPPREQAKWKRKIIVTLALTFLTSSQAILIVWSKIAGKYEYNVTTANFMVETLKCALSLVALARIWKSEGVTDDNRDRVCIAMDGAFSSGMPIGVRPHEAKYLCKK